MDDREKAKKLHDTISFVGLRAQATAIGLVQLTAELRRAGVLDEAAIERIKAAIANDINVSRSSARSRGTFEAMVKRRLDILFAPQDPSQTVPHVGDTEEGRAALGLEDRAYDDGSE